MAKFGAAGGVAGILGKEIVGETIEGGFRLAAAGITAAGTAVAGAMNAAGTALGGALQGAMTPAPTTVVNNVGMVGEVAKKKVVTGSGTIPAPKKTSKPAVNPNMPTEKLLVIAVKYLTSIDKTLQDQINFERLALERQAQAEKEAAIEGNTGPNAFSRLGDRLGAIKDKAADKASDAASLAKKLLAGTALAGLGFFGLGALTTEQSKLDELKENWKAFQVEYKWLLDLAKYLGAGVVGGSFGGVPGAIAAIVLTYLGDRGMFNNVPVLGDVFGNNSDATGGASSPPGVIGAGITAGIAGYAGYRGVKTVGDVRSRLGTMAQQRAAPRAAPSLRGTGFRDPKTGRIVSKQAVAAGEGWLSGPAGRRFVAFLSKRFGKTYIAKKVFPFLARVFAGVAITATGVGAIPGILWTLVNIGLSVWTVYDLITAYWDWTEEEKLRKDAEAVNNATPKADATPTVPVGNAPAATSNSESGKPEEAMSFFTSPQGGGWTKEQAAGIVANLVQESRLDPNITGDGGKAYGLAQWHADRQANFQRVFNKSIRGSTFQEQLQFVNWELNNTEAAAGRALRGASTAEEATRIVSEKYERAGTPMMERRLGNASALMAGNYAAVGTSGGNGGTGSALAGSVAETTLDGMKAFGSIIKGIGKQVVGERTYTPMSAQTADNAKAIAEASTKLEATVALGEANKKSEKTLKMSNLMKSLSQASPTNTIQAIDPNYAGGGDIVKYLQYHKLATPKTQAA